MKNAIWLYLRCMLSPQGQSVLFFQLATLAGVGAFFWGLSSHNLVITIASVAMTLIAAPVSYIGTRGLWRMRNDIVAARRNPPGGYDPNEIASDGGK